MGCSCGGPPAGGGGIQHIPGCAEAEAQLLVHANVGGCGGTSTLRTLTAQQAQGTLMHRMSRLADRFRQMEVNFGLRPYTVHLVWTRWTGAERGEGRESLQRRVALVPNPIVEDLTSISLSPFAAGILPVGSVRISRISARYPQDLLMGLVMPCDPKLSLESQLSGGPPVDSNRLAFELEQVPQPWEFFYEVVEDGRSAGGRPPRRERFRALSNPTRNAEQLEWVIVLERVSESMGRNGLPRDDD